MIASGYQLMVKQKGDRRHSLNDIWPNIFPPGSPKHNTLTEISGNPGIGKSELLFRIISRAVLPELYGGKSSEVIFIDLNHKHEADDFEKCLESVMTDLYPLNTQIELAAVQRNCLKSVIGMSCYSSEHFDLALDELEDLLWDHENVSLLAIDGLDAFYWEECYERLQRMSTHYKKLCQRVKPICQENNICCIYTVDSNYLQSKSKGKVSVFNPLIDYKLKLTKKGDECLLLNGKPFAFDDPPMPKAE